MEGRDSICIASSVKCTAICRVQSKCAELVLQVVVCSNNDRPVKWCVH